MLCNIMAYHVIMRNLVWYYAFVFLYHSRTWWINHRPAARCDFRHGQGWAGFKQKNTGLACVAFTLRLFNIAIENSPFIDDFPMKTTIYSGFSMAMLNNQMVNPHQIPFNHHFPMVRLYNLYINQIKNHIVICARQICRDFNRTWKTRSSR